MYGRRSGKKEKRVHEIRKLTHERDARREKRTRLDGVCREWAWKEWASINLGGECCPSSK